MVRFSNGFYSFSDGYLKSMRKQDLINYIRTIEKNWENQLITNDIQYKNCMKLLAEERNKAIDEFCEKLCDVFCENSFQETINGIKGVSILTLDKLVEIAWDLAEDMKGVRNERLNQQTGSN